MSMESVMRKMSSLSIRQIVCLMMALQLITLGMPMPVNAHGNGGNGADDHTRTPIKHVIVIIGENRTFDHLFATWR